MTNPETSSDLVKRLRAEWTSSDSIQLHIGECTAQELRSIKAVAVSILSEVARSIADDATTIERLTVERDEWRETAEVANRLVAAMGTKLIAAEALVARQALTAALSLPLKGEAI